MQTLAVASADATAIAVMFGGRYRVPGLITVPVAAVESASGNTEVVVAVKLVPNDALKSPLNVELLLNTTYRAPLGTNCTFASVDASAL